jgi:hypothetical protein
MKREKGGESEGGRYRERESGGYMQEVNREGGRDGFLESVKGWERRTKRGGRQ